MVFPIGYCPGANSDTAISAVCACVLDPQSYIRFAALQALPKLAPKVHLGGLGSHLFSFGYVGEKPGEPNGSQGILEKGSRRGSQKPKCSISQKPAQPFKLFVKS